MIKVIIPTFLEKKNVLNNETISDICFRSFGESDFVKESEKRGNGRYIKLEKDNEVHYVCLSANESEYDGRNSFLSQFLGTAYSRFLQSSEENKKMEVYLLMTNEHAFSAYQKFIYRCCKTLGVKLLNVATVYLPFASCKELKDARTQVSSRNTGNKSSYFSDNGDDIELFAKCYGANGKESVFMAMVVRQLTDKQIIIYQVEDHGQKSLSEPDREILKQAGFKFGEDITSDEFGKVDLNKDEKDLRNQPAFKLNLFEKFGDKKCYLCDCDIDHMIIASHIHRVTDIKNDTALNDDEKKKQIIDGDNGLWLCANHDKLFEYGLIYFNNKDLIISNRLNDSQKDYVKNITAESSIKDCDFNVNMVGYLNLHKARAEQIGK